MAHLQQVPHAMCLPNPENPGELLLSLYSGAVEAQEVCTHREAASSGTSAAAKQPTRKKKKGKAKKVVAPESPPSVEELGDSELDALLALMEHPAMEECQECVWRESGVEESACMRNTGGRFCWEAFVQQDKLRFTYGP